MDFLDKYFYFFKFFTSWSLVLALLHNYVHEHVNLLYISFVTLIMGSYMSFVKPGFFIFYFDNEKIVYRGLRKLLVIDLCFHLLVFLFVYWNYKDFYIQRGGLTGIGASFVIMFVYIIIINFEKMYGISYLECFAIFFVSSSLYYILFVNNK